MNTVNLWVVQNCHNFHDRTESRAAAWFFKCRLCSKHCDFATDVGKINIFFFKYSVQREGGTDVKENSTRF